MSTIKLRRFMTSMMVTVLLMSTLFGAASAAPVAQAVNAQEVTGTIDGGEFKEIWLGLETGIQNEDITITSTWNRNDPAGNGLGFYVLTAEQRSEVEAGANPATNNLATATSLGPETPDNEIGVKFRATSDNYTIIVYNNSNDDAVFSMAATNASIADGSGSVEAVGMDDEMADEEMADEDAVADDEDAVADDADADEPVAEDAEEEIEEAADAVDEVTETDVAETEDVADAEEMDDMDAEEDAAPVADGTPTVVEATELSGYLPEANDMHFLGLEPDVRDGTMDLIYSFNPQDSSELATRTGFWVLEPDAFNRYLNPGEEVVLSEVAIAAGSGDQPGLMDNERAASFTASGMGPYTVVIYNNSDVPADYTLSVVGGMLRDDSGQTTSAEEMMDDEEMSESAIEVDEEEDVETTPGREGEPGGSYTVVAGDTLSLIAGDVYGEFGYWRDICAYNDLDSCDTIEIGDVIQLPPVDELGADVTLPAEDDEEVEDTAADVVAVADDTEDAAEADDAAADDEEENAAADIVTTTPPTADLEEDDADADEVVEAVPDSDEADATDDDEAGTEASDSAADVDLFTLIAGQGSMTILTQALEATGLDEVLANTDDTFTLFAPSDAAFEASLANYEQLYSDPEGILTKILTYHVIPGSQIMAADISDAMQALSANDELPVEFEVTPDQVKIQDSVIVSTDNEAINGVVHIIDKVMFPQNINE